MELTEISSHRLKLMYETACVSTDPYLYILSASKRC